MAHTNHVPIEIGKVVTVTGEVTSVGHTEMLDKGGQGRLVTVFILDEPGNE